MSLVTAIKISLHFLERELFDEINFSVEKGERIGLVGPNGSGKTTLLRIIMGEISPDHGTVNISRGSRVGYLPQDIQETSSDSLLRSILHSIPGRLKLKRDLEQAENALNACSTKEDQALTGKKIAEIHHEINRIDLEFPNHDAEKILLGLGFKIDQFEMPLSALSGGWKMRAALASLLYQKPDLLLLDEPTNHLDMPSVRWLEQYLQNHRGAILLVSHDREFLNRQVSRIVSFEMEGMRSYSGNYDHYLKARSEEVKSLEAKAKNQDQKIKDAQKFIDRFRFKSTKARQAQSKIKLLEKMELVKTHRSNKTIHFSFPDAPRCGRIVTTISNLSKSFATNILYKDLNLTIPRGDRIAIIGPNGCGKTTLLKMIAREMLPDSGDISLGHEVDIAYFAQHHSDMLDPGKTVVEEVYKAVPEATIGFVRSVCGAFLFSGADVDKRINILSGGERARVSLARLLVKPGNFMLMDEPTNHLDIQSSETLIDALKDYSGTLLFVSHNQSFVNGLATKIWDVVEEGIVEYPGSLDEYYQSIQDKEKNAVDAMSTPEKIGQGRNTGKTREDKKREKREKAEKRQQIHNTVKPIRVNLARVEDRIAKMETRQKEVEKDLANPDIFQDQERSVPLLAEYKNLREELDTSFLEWEKLQEKLELAQSCLEG
jgi:ATP-binding cassette subfamily F protein 3